MPYDNICQVRSGRIAQKYCAELIVTGLLAGFSPMVLAALAGQANEDGDMLPEASTLSSEQLMKASASSFKYVCGMMFSPSCSEDLVLGLAVLRLLNAIVSATEEHIGERWPGTIEHSAQSSQCTIGMLYNTCT